jgi:Excalibur calcium-binding domain
MARHHRKQEPGSAWGALLGVPLMLGFGYYVSGDAVPLVNTLTMSASERAKIERSVTYSGCREVRRLGKAPLYAGQPGYRETMDGDGDGIACENY